MNFVSYAPNFEDILLWRALRHVTTGFYLDIGAADPLHGSVTQAFYQRGWQGVNVEPAPALHARLAAARPADINLAIGIAASTNTQAQPFFDVQDSQRSSFSLSQAQASRDAGLTVIQREARVSTLADVCRQHVSGPVHFLNLSTNGGEAEVLASMDWQVCRPWIVLIRTGEHASSYSQLMQAAHYQLAYQDGQKQYFVAQEHSELLPRLALAPHGDDQFTLYEGHHYAHPLDDWRQRTEQAERAAKEANTWAIAHERSWTERAAHAETQLAQALKDLQHTESTLSRALQAANARAEQAEASAAHEGANGRRVEAELAAIYASRAWKLSKPIRGIVKLAQLARNQLRHLIWRTKHLLVQCLRRGKAAILLPIKMLLKASLQFITARPALAFFLRRQLARFPRMVGLLRTIAIRLKAPAPGADPNGMVTTDLQQLPASARNVYSDLQRTLQRARHPSAPK